MYGITQHKDLIPYLGEKWFIRGINAHLDFCAVLAETNLLSAQKSLD